MIKQTITMLLLTCSVTTTQPIFRLIVEQLRTRYVKKLIIQRRELIAEHRKFIAEHRKLDELLSRYWNTRLGRYTPDKPLSFSKYLNNIDTHCTEYSKYTHGKTI